MYTLHEQAALLGFLLCSQALKPSGNIRPCQLKVMRWCVLPFTVRRVSVGVRGLSRMPEETVAFSWPADAIEAAPGPRWTGVPAVLHGGADEHRVAFRKDAFGVAITPAGEQQPGKEKKGGEHERVLWWQMQMSRSLARGKEGLCCHLGCAA